MIEIPIKIDTYAFITLMGVVQGFFLSLFFLYKKHDFNRLLGFYLLSSVLLTLDSLLGYTNVMLSVIYLNDFSETCNLLVGPLLYLFTYQALKKEAPVKVFVHFIPAILFLIASLPYIFGDDTNKYNSFLDAYYPEIAHISSIEYFNIFGFRDVVNEIVISSKLIYLVLTIRIIVGTQKTISDSKWYIILVLNGFALVSRIGHVNFHYIYDSDLGSYILSLFESFFFYSLSFILIKESFVFKENHSKKKYEKSGLDDALKEQILSRIIVVLEKEKYFLNKESSLPDLSKKVRASVNQISQVINECLGKSYSDLISYYRIEEAKKFLINNTNISLEHLAFEVGFNSKSSFYTAFKKHTGETPTLFKNALKSL